MAIWALREKAAANLSSHGYLKKISITSILNCSEDTLLIKTLKIVCTNYIRV